MWKKIAVLLAALMLIFLTMPSEARMGGLLSQGGKMNQYGRSLLQETEQMQGEEETQQTQDEMQQTQAEMQQAQPMETTNPADRNEVAQSWVEVPFFRGVADHWQSTVEAVGEKASKHITKPTKQWVASASDNLNKNLKPYVGEKAAPKVTTFICFVLVIAPLAATAALCSSFRHVLSLQRILMAIHLYLATYFLIMAFAQLYFRGEPMRLLQQHSVDSYVLFQLLQSIGYLVFISLQCLQTLVMVRSGIPLMQALAWVELIASVGVGIHYYIMVWQPAMLDQPPNIDFIFYLFYSVIFGAMIAVSKYVNYTITSARDVEKLLQGQKLAPKLPSAFDGPEKRA